MADSNKKVIGQFIKFALIGVVNTLVDLIVFKILNAAFHWVIPAQIIAYAAGIANSYILNSSWTFREERKRDVREMILFIAVNLVSLGVSIGVLKLCEHCGITDTWVETWRPGFLAWLLNGAFVCKLIATPCAIVVNFIGNKLFVFKKNAE